MSCWLSQIGPMNDRNEQDSEGRRGVQAEGIQNQIMESVNHPESRSHGFLQAYRRSRS